MFQKRNLFLFQNKAEIKWREFLKEREPETFKKLDMIPGHPADSNIIFVTTKGSGKRTRQTESARKVGLMISLYKIRKKFA